MVDPTLPESSSRQRNFPPWGAVALSFLLSGLGQFMLGQVEEGVLWFVGLTVGLVCVGWVAMSPEVPGLKAAVVGLALLTVAWLVMLVRAYCSTPRAENRQLNRPWIALLLSGILPGLGQLYDGALLRGFVFLALFASVGFLPGQLMVFSLRAVTVLALLDAYRGASLRVMLPDRRIILIAVAAVGSQILSAGEIAAVKTFLVQPFKVPTVAMRPTLHGVTKLPDGHTTVGDHIFVDKLTYHLRAPKRGEIVVFRTDGIQAIPPESPGHYWVKRIVGLPGERVSIRPPFVCVNGQPVTEPAVFQTIQRQQHGYTGYLLPSAFPTALLRSETDAIQLGNDEYLVFGDNSASSFDGRFWGALPQKNIIGRVTKIYWPLDRAGIRLAE